MNRLLQNPQCVIFLVLAISVMAKAEVGALLWEDNFNTLDQRVWNIDTGDGCNQNLCGWGNQELQWYHAENVSIANIPGEIGNKALILTAKNQSFENRAFTSGKINSQHKVAIQYGMIETRIKAPVVSTGLWPAAWLLGTDSSPWPLQGEIDIMEMGHKEVERTRQGYTDSDVNSYVGSNLIFYVEEACTLSNPTCAASTAFDSNYNKPYLADTPLSDRFVVYRLYWTDKAIRLTVLDLGTEYDLYEAPFKITEITDEFQQPFYILFNLAVGGNFTDAATNAQINAPLPAELAIDYIRVYEFKGQGKVINDRLDDVIE